MHRGDHGVREVAEEFDISVDSAQRLVKQSQRDRSQRLDGLSTSERREPLQLRRDVRRLRMEREILAKAAAWFARGTDSTPSGSSNSYERTRATIRSP